MKTERTKKSKRARKDADILVKKKKSKRARKDADIPETTKKSKRAKKETDIPESLDGEPSGNNVSDLEIPVPPAEIVSVRISLTVFLFLTIKFFI